MPFDFEHDTLGRLPGIRIEMDFIYSYLALGKLSLNLNDYSVAMTLHITRKTPDKRIGQPLRTVNTVTENACGCGRSARS